MQQTNWLCWRNTLSNDKKMRIEFAPGAFDQFDGTQEELDALVAELERMAESGELEANSVDLEHWDDLDEEDRAIIEEALDRQQPPRSLN
jgi:hypothetical protein